MRALVLLLVLMGPARADVAVAPAGRVEQVRAGKLESFIDPTRGVTEIVFITDVGADGPGPKRTNHRCGKELKRWIGQELRPILARDFDSPDAACEGDVCSGPNARTEEWGLQTALYFKGRRLYAVVRTSQYRSSSEADDVDAFVHRQLEIAGAKTCRRRE